MTWGNGAMHVGTKFGQSFWINLESAQTYLFLYRQLTNDHGLDAITATDVLESAYRAASREIESTVCD